MQADEGVRVQPVPSHAVPPIDHDHADVRMIDQGVGERHPGRARADHQVVGFQPLGHALIVTTPPRTVNNLSRPAPADPEPGRLVTR